MADRSKVNTGRLRVSMVVLLSKVVMVSLSMDNSLLKGMASSSSNRVDTGSSSMGEDHQVDRHQAKAILHSKVVTVNLLPHLDISVKPECSQGQSGAELWRTEIHCGRRENGGFGILADRPRAFTCWS